MDHIRKALGIFLSRYPPGAEAPYSQEMVPALVVMVAAVIVLLLERWF